MERLLAAYRPEPDGFLRPWGALEYSGRAADSHETRAQTIAHAKELAKKQALGQVIIHKQDGTIQTEHTYGKDPYPPEG